MLLIKPIIWFLLLWLFTPSNYEIILWLLNYLNCVQSALVMIPVKQFFSEILYLLKAVINIGSQTWEIPLLFALLHCCWQNMKEEHISPPPKLIYEIILISLLVGLFFYMSASLLTWVFPWVSFLFSRVTHAVMWATHRPVLQSNVWPTADTHL